MKQLRLVAFVLAATWIASAAYACDESKGASAANARGTCGAHAASATAAVATSGGGASAACPAVAAACKSTGTSATAASMKGTCTAQMSAQCTAAMRAQCTAAMRAQCAKGNRASAASVSGGQCNHAGTAATAATMDCCASRGASAASAGGCPGHGVRSAAMAKGAGGCPGNASMAGMTHCDKAALHGDCSVCLDEANCSNALRAAGVRAQVVALRNGAMIVYTADNAESVRSLQTTVARYNEHIMNAYAGGDDATLCGECKAFRGAMASGKFSRELVNVKNGCQILLTSPDRTIVRKIHDLTAAQVAARVRT